MIGGFRKTSKRVNIRKKVATDDSDEDEGGIEQTPAPTPAIEKPPKPIKKSGSALSFGDELEGEDQFVLKRSKASINMSEQTKKEKKLKKKKEKEKNKQNEMKDIEPVENLVSSNNGFVIKTFEDDEAIDTYDANMTETAHKFSLKEKFSKSDIPDAATIYAMKKQREQARQFGGQVNYMPLNSNTYEGRFQTASKSRLVREEMDDSSDDERLEMKGSAKENHPALERRKQVAQALEEAQEEDDEEAKRHVDFDEFQRWEDEQIKKGSKMPTNQSETYGPRLPDGNVSGPMIYLKDVTGLYPTNYNYPSQVSTYAPQIYAAPQAVPVAQTEIVTADVICGRLIECLETKKKLFELHTLEKEKTAFNLDSSNQNIKDLKRKNEDIADRFTFYQDIRGFVKDLVECLNEKVQRINSLESSMHQALQKNAQKLLTRRQNDVKDEVDEIAGKPNTESDRITNIKSRRIAEREARRARRREKRRIEASVKDHYEGMSSDDEMIPSDALRFQADKDKITKEVDTVFADVVTEFSSLDEIRNRFEQWKYGFSDSYKEAYLGLCLPKLFTPFIKLELLNWNPLELYESQDFEDMNWYRTLVQYGDHGGQVTAEDEDTKLLPNIIEKVLIPKLTVLIKDVWDPMSSKQTKLAAFLFQRLADDYPTITSESKHTKYLVEVIVSKLKNTVETDIYIPLYPKTQLEASNSRALVFLERQFWKGVKLLGNLMAWNWLLSAKKLRELGVDAILNRYLVIALQQFPDPVACLEKAKVIVNVLPKEWFEQSDKIVPGLQSFARLLITVATNTFKCSLGYTSEVDKKKMRITIKKIISLLMHIQAFDEARFVATNFKDEVKKDSPASSPSVTSPIT